jgi:hypothetical protein
MGGGPNLRRAWCERPTVSGTVTAGITVVLLLVTATVLVIPAVFSLVPISPDADAVTLCLPGIGPLQRFADGLRGEREELAYIHEHVHMKQCQSFGATAFARLLVTPHGRLALEAPALCAEVAVLSIRGADRDRLMAWTVETLVTEYFDDGEVGRREIADAVNGVCGGVSSE